jgi:hypothetical protein
VDDAQSRPASAQEAVDSIAAGGARPRDRRGRTAHATARLSEADAETAAPRRFTLTGTDVRTIPIKVLGHWVEARAQMRRSDLFVDIPAELIRLVEADHPGHGQRSGYQLMIERRAMAEFFGDDLHWLDELYEQPAEESVERG